MEIVETTKPSQIRLREEFLEPYRRKGDPFQSLLARSTYLTKYCRGNVETWTDTIRRVVEGNMSLAVGTTEVEAELLFHLFWTGQALPPGRGLWTGGIDGIPADARFNCFAPETKFFANGVLTTMAEAVGQTVEVLAKDGQWRPAQVRAFGRQKLRRVVFKAPGRSKFGFEFVATAEHRWFTSNRGEVTDLRVGDRVVVEPKAPHTSSPDFTDGFAHGFVFGDGSQETLKPGTYRLRLCGEKDWQHKDQLRQASMFHNESAPPSFGKDPLLFFKSTADLKALPHSSSSLNYKAGFLAGWLAADGSLRTSNVGGNRLASQNADALDWAAEWAPLLGYCITGRSMDPSIETNYGARHSRLEILTLTTLAVEYTVRAIVDEGREEEVFCVTEPETHSFTLGGGVVTGNCWYTTLYGVEDWCWAANSLMLGGGVGIGLGDLQALPVVEGKPSRFAIWCSKSHADIDEVEPEGPEFLNGSTPVYRVPDSREGWVEALRQALTAAFTGQDLVIDVSDIRPRGMPIKTFGGIACGPGPLAHLLRSTWRIVRGAAGRRLTSVECLDVTNHIGLCIKSGNVRRSALIVLGQAQDQSFRDAKKDWDAVASHRHTSNNSIVFRTKEEIANFDWTSLVQDNIDFGEPGLLNLAKIWETDPGARGINPCGEIPLHDREACNLAEVFPAQFEQGMDPRITFKLITRYCLRNRLTPLLDEKADAVQAKNMRLGVGLGGLCDFAWKPEQLAEWYGIVRSEADNYADELGVNRPLAVTTTKPSGTISLLNGSSPGIHAPFAPYYIRRTRIAKNDPMAMAMIEAGVPFDECVYDKSGHTWVFSFPTMAPHTRTTVQTQNIREQFERQATVQEWWSDNAVSATLNFDPNTETAELAVCLAEYAPRLKSTSCLAKGHSYQQAPYEEVTQDVYERMMGNIDHGHKLVNGGEIEIEECSGGVCPIR
jgi:hypothetical protein